jgi:L-lactate dehydrogenase complex protein LldF
MSTAAVQFKRDARRLSADRRHREIIDTALNKYAVKRDEKKALFQDWEGARQLAAEIKWEAVNHLDRYLEQFVRGLEAPPSRRATLSSALPGGGTRGRS